MPNAAIRAEQTEDRAVQTYRLGTVETTVASHYIPKIGPRVFAVFDETGGSYHLPLTAENARLLGMGMIAAACRAEALERAAKRQAEARERAAQQQRHETKNEKDADVLLHIEHLLASGDKP